MGGLLPSTHPHISGKEEDLILQAPMLEYIIDVQTWFVPLSRLKYLISGQPYSANFILKYQYYDMYSKKKWKRRKEWAVLLSYYDSKDFFLTRCLSWTLYAWGRLGSGWFKVLAECSACAMFNNVKQCAIMCNVQQCSTMFNVCNVQQRPACAMFNNVQCVQFSTMFNIFNG